MNGRRGLSLTPSLDKGRPNCFRDRPHRPGSGGVGAVKGRDTVDDSVEADAREGRSVLAGHFGSR